MTDASDVLFFGNTAGRSGPLTGAPGERALFGFPAAGGVREGPVIKYVLIRQQKTTLGEPGGAKSARVRRLQALFGGAGLPVVITANIDGWLLTHAAFVVPIPFALYRDGTDAAQLARDRETLRLMVRATRQAFEALRVVGNAEIPANLNVLYLRMLEAFAVRYWRRVLASPRGELWFAAHSRAAPEEMTTLSRDLQDVVHRTGHPAPALDALLSPAAIGRTAVWRLRSRQARLPVTGRAGRCGRRGGRSWRSCAPWWWPGWWCSTRQGCSPWARRGSSKDPGSAIGFTVLLLLGAESGQPTRRFLVCGHGTQVKARSLRDRVSLGRRACLSAGTAGHQPSAALASSDRSPTGSRRAFMPNRSRVGR